MGGVYTGIVDEVVQLAVCNALDVLLELGDRFGIGDVGGEEGDAAGT
jgi:hypothetical protein